MSSDKQNRIKQIKLNKPKYWFPIKQKFIITSFYTNNTSYEQEMKERLLPSIQKFKLNYDVQGIENKGSWQKNIYQKAYYLLKMLEIHPKKNIIWLDSDAEIRIYPKLFANLKVDFAAHFRFARKLSSGTMLLRNNSKVLGLVKDWIKKIESHPNLETTSEQEILLDLIVEKKDLNVFHLPLEYSMIFDGEQVERPVIVHHQASRRMKF